MTDGPLRNFASSLPIPGTEKKEVVIGPPETSNYLDHLAAMIMAALLSNPEAWTLDFSEHPDDIDDCENFYNNIAAHAYMAAKSLISERGNQ